VEVAMVEAVLVSRYGRMQRAVSRAVRQTARDTLRHDWTDLRRFFLPPLDLSLSSCSNCFIMPPGPDINVSASIVSTYTHAHARYMTHRPIGVQNIQNQ